MLASGIILDNVSAARTSPKGRSFNNLLFPVLEIEVNFLSLGAFSHFLFESNTNITITICPFVIFPRAQASETKMERMTE